MLVKVKFIKDHNGYKAGDEWPMMLSYAEKYKAKGIVQIVGGNIDKWFVKPEVEDEDTVEDETAKNNETEYNYLERLLNNIK
jgi:hypothetical protein